MYGRTVKRIRQADRGKGRGADYMPYFQIGDVPSRGWSHRFLSWTTGREIHCLSNLEYGYALIADWSPMVVDIREQMPLSVSETMHDTKGPEARAQTETFLPPSKCARYVGLRDRIRP